MSNSHSETLPDAVNVLRAKMSLTKCMIIDDYAKNGETGAVPNIGSLSFARLNNKKHNFSI